MGKISFRSFKNFIKIRHHEKRIIRKAFDANFYLRRYPDIKQSKIDPLTHFMQYGWKEGRNPSALFDAKYYLEKYDDVREARMNPLWHYVSSGHKQERSIYDKELKKKDLKIIDDQLTYDQIQ